ncbi:MAG TPA: PIN domain-containing protein [Chloroflexota bacterium]|nr:PIN domain-containing protein [Chloroflexota bacterium]HUM70743.1 PIN domain-containing protein [Chloroflexota bacterium]
MTIFADTSAFLAMLDVRDKNAPAAHIIWMQLVQEDDVVITSSYVLLEAFALIQNRLGLIAVRDFQDKIVPMLEIEWVGPSLYQAGLAALLTANRRQLSLVDCVSFETCRRNGIDTVFAFDQHFIEQGFTCLLP